MASWKTYLEENQDRALKELLEFLSIPSISGLKVHKEDVKKAADWVAARLQSGGLENVRFCRPADIRSFTGIGCMLPISRPF